MQKLQKLYIVWLVLQIVKGKKFECPKLCTCNAAMALTDCRHNNLSQLLPEINNKTQLLDLSFNAFEGIPKNICNYRNLQHLNMSHNKLSYLDRISLENLQVLKVLDLSYNFFVDWIDIHNEALLTVPLLIELHLSSNTLGGFPDLTLNYPLMSDSLKSLFLINCSLTNMLGDVLLGIPNLETLNLAENPLMTINTEIRSRKLRTIDFTLCNLQQIRKDAIVGLPNLETLILSKNYQLRNFHSNSKSLRVLDISYCNLKDIPSVHLPNLTQLNLKRNHLGVLPANGFHLFPLVHSIDLSKNAIERINTDAFLGLKFLQNLELSYNTITEVAAETFQRNTRLQGLNLSRNYLNKIGQLVSESLIWLDLSVCEIREIKKDSLIMMPKLQSLNLSRNLISHLPNKLQSDELRVLDLSMCGIFALNNLTFSALKQLRTLNLAGNRLTSGIRPSYFYGVTNLQLEDNSWLCDCSSDDFRELYQWLFKVHSSASNLRCRSPEQSAGFSWQAACYDIWFTVENVRSDNTWIYSISLIVLMASLCCVLILIKQFYRRKAILESELREQEREEARERLRQIQQRNLHYSLESIERNAPDPRELQGPPSYTEAVSMPRLNVSCSSLAGSYRSLHSLQSTHLDAPRRTKLRRKRRRSRQENKANVSETQSAASLSHANTEASNSDDERRPAITNHERNVITESSF